LGKRHFIVTKGIVLGRKITGQAKIDVIEKLPPPVSVKGVRSFLVHGGFYWHFIKYFSKIANPFYNHLVNENDFMFDSGCLDSFALIKNKLVTAPVIIALNWDNSFKLMCDTSDYAVRSIFRQCKKKCFYAIYYSSKVLNENQVNYSTTVKELVL
jgi:hypothetical protein